MNSAALDFISLHDLFTNSPCLMGIVEIRGDDILHLADNPQTCRFFGTTPAEMAGKLAHREMGVPKESLHLWLTNYAKARSTGQPVAFEYEHRLPSGESYWLNVTVSSIGEGPDGSPRFSYIGMNTTDIHQMSQRLSVNEEKYRRLLETAQEGVFISDMAGKIEFCNEQAATLAGRPVSEIVGRSGLYIIEPEDHAIVLAALERRRQGVSESYEIRLRRPDGSHRWVIVNASPVVGSQGSPVGTMALITDVTARREAEGKIRDHQAALAAQSRYFAFSEMAAGLAHEINNPLAIIRGRAEQLWDLVNKPSPHPEAIRHALSRISETTARIAGLINNLSLFSGKPTTEIPLKVPLRSLVNDADLLFRVRAQQRQVDIQKKLSDDLYIQCDRAAMIQVIYNLIANGIEAAATGPVPRWVRIEAAKQDSTTEILVVDSGPGVPGEIKERIFEPFFSTQPLGRATGIGLTVSRALVEANGGKLDLIVGSPTTFRVSIPVDHAS